MRTTKTSNTNIDKAVAYYLIMAQMCSNAGKDYDLSSYTLMSANDIKKAYHFRYGRKNYYIEKAIERILRLKGKAGVYFFIDKDIDEGDSCWYDIVYFNMKIDGVRHQISFHAPYGVRKDLREKYGDTHNTRWDKLLGGSDETCHLLMKKVLN